MASSGNPIPSCSSSMLPPPPFSFPSSSSGPFIPALNLVPIKEKEKGSRIQSTINAFQTLINSNRSDGTPMSTERARRAGLSRSVSNAPVPQPLPIPDLFNDHNVVRCHSMNPNLLMPVELHDRERKASIENAERILRCFYQKVRMIPHSDSGEDRNKPIYSRSWFLFLRTKDGNPSWRNIKTCKKANKLSYNLERSEAALQCVLRAIKTLARNHQYTISIEKKQFDDQGVIETVPLSFILDRCLSNPNMFRIANTTELNRHKIAKSYILFKVGMLHHNCEAIAQTLDEFEKFDIFDRIRELRQRATQRRSPSKRRNSSFNFGGYGYQEMVESFSHSLKADFSRRLLFEPGLLMTYNGESLIDPKSCFAKCREGADRAIRAIQERKHQIQGKLKPGMDFESTFLHDIDSCDIERTISNFASGFKWFIHSTLSFLSQHYKKEIKELEVEMDLYYDQLEQGIGNPLNWNILRLLLSRLNHRVYQIILKSGVEKPSQKLCNFIATPRN